MATPSPRISYLTLDVWRGIASLMVVLYHTAGVHGLHHPELKTTPLFRLAGYGWLGVQVFFVVSGFCIANAAVISLARDPGVGSFFMARLRRIFPPYWCAFLLYVLFLLSTAALSASGMLASNGLAENLSGLLTVPNLFMNTTLTQYLGHAPSILPVSWTLCYEVAFYCIVGGMLMVVGRRAGPRAMLRSLHCLTLLCIIALIVRGFWTPYPFNLWPHFGLGVLLYDLLATPDNREPRYWAVGIVAAESILLVGQDYWIAEQPLRLSTIVALLFTASLLSLHRFDARTAKHRSLAGLAFIGGFSYSLYLTHHYILRVGLQLFDKLRLPDPGGLVGLLVGTSISIVFAAVFFRLCEKPFLKKRSTK